MRVIVTGAAGFIGSHVVDRLLAAGNQVYGIDNLDPYYSREQKLRNIEEAKSSRDYQMNFIDIRERGELAKVFDAAQADGVVHLAARAGVRASVEMPLSYIEVNEIGGFNVLDECMARGKVPLVLASTSSVYGASTQIPCTEELSACEPLSPYAASKRASELMAHSYWHIHQQPVAILRFFTVYGPRGRPDMAFAKFTEAMLRGEPITIHGPDTERDFTYIDDIVDGVLAALNWVVDGRGFDTFNIGGSLPVNVQRMVEILADELKISAVTRMGELQPGESLKTAADVARAQRAFAFAPKVSLVEGTRRWVEWLRSWEAPPALRLLLEASKSLPVPTESESGYQNPRVGKPPRC